MPRETCTAPATLPLFSTSGASRTSTTSVLPFAIISCAWAGVIFGTAALAASIICLTLVVMSHLLVSLLRCPLQRLLEPVVAPEQFAVGGREARRAEQPEAVRLRRLRPQPRLGLVGLGRRKHGLRLNLQLRENVPDGVGFVDR